MRILRGSYANSARIGDADKKLDHRSGLEIRMYDRDAAELALLAVKEGMSHAEGAEHVAESNARRE